MGNAASATGSPLDLQTCASSWRVLSFECVRPSKDLGQNLISRGSARVSTAIPPLIHF